MPESNCRARIAMDAISQNGRIQSPCVHPVFEAKDFWMPSWLESNGPSAGLPLRSRHPKQGSASSISSTRFKAFARVPTNLP